MSRNTVALAVVFFLVCPVLFLHAEKIGSPAKGFSISLSKDWVELPVSFQGVAASYAKKGTMATFHIKERDLEGPKTIDQLSWESLFSPEFGSINIHSQSTALLGGEKAKFCVYTLKPGEFKKTMEGKLPGKYINYVLVHKGKLFSITFMDREDGFALNYPSFLAAIRTLRFDAIQPASQRKPL